MSRKILYIVAAAWVLAFIWQTYAHAMQPEADTCGPLPDVCNVTATAAPSGNPEWPIRLTVENNSDRKLAAIKWVCRGRPWEVADPTNPGVMLESRDVEAHSTKSWDFRIAGLEPSFPYCKTGLFEWWK